jgi:hypothetical protein
MVEPFPWALVRLVPLAVIVTEADATTITVPEVEDET